MNAPDRLVKFHLYRDLLFCTLANTLLLHISFSHGVTNRYHAAERRLRTPVGQLTLGCSLPWSEWEWVRPLKISKSWEKVPLSLRFVTILFYSLHKLLLASLYDLERTAILGNIPFLYNPSVMPSPTPSPTKLPRKRRVSSPIISTAVSSRSGSSSPISPADLVAAIVPSVENTRETSQGPYLHPAQHVSFMSHFTPQQSAPGYVSNMNINAGNPRPAASNAESNVPDRFELFLLGDGEKKVSEEADTRKSKSVWQ